MSTDSDTAAVGKRCTRCGEWKPFDCFWRDSGNTPPYFSWCKQCAAQRRADACEANKRRCVVEPAEGTENAPNLYVMCLSIDPLGDQYGLKIGRAFSAALRAQALRASMPFRVQVLAELYGLGHLEAQVHATLAGRRVVRGSGREWFHVSLSDALHAIARVNATQQISTPQCGLQQDAPRMHQD